jgi:hypothetical protein
MVFRYHPVSLHLFNQELAGKFSQFEGRHFHTADCRGHQLYGGFVIEADQSDILWHLQPFFSDGQHGSDRDAVADGEDGIRSFFHAQQVEGCPVSGLLTEITVYDQIRVDLPF